MDDFLVVIDSLRQTIGRLNFSTQNAAYQFGTGSIPHSTLLITTLELYSMLVVIII